MYSIVQLQKVMENLGLEPYRARQLFQWLWQKNVADFSQMTNFSKALRNELTEKFMIESPNIIQVLNAHDGTKKYLIELYDKKRVEAVFIPEEKRKTVCISTQVGCALGCRFCATGLMNFERNLLAGEIASEVQLIQLDIGAKPTNVVFMGMGEPLLNVQEVMQAVEIISSSIGLGISQRHITISTAGVIDGMIELLNSPLKVKLAISLNFADEDLRKEMMPVAKKNPLKEVLKLAQEYSRKKEMVTFEYVMIKGLNDRLSDAKRLLKLLEKIPSKINLIPYNEHPLLPYKASSLETIIEFQKYLFPSKHTVTIRKSKGQEILAGCGQLALGSYAFSKS